MIAIALPLVDEARLQAAIADVCAMSDDEFEAVAKSIGLNPLAGMSSGRKARLRRAGLL